MSKVHMIRGRGGIEPTKTYCGKAGWKARGWSHEYETVGGSRFEATDDTTRIDCARCRQLLGVEKVNL